MFAVGARPIAVLDSLRFGEPADSERSRYLLERAVAGIGHYGNSIGVATVGGEIYFESAYEQNCLVNAMCLGLIETDKLIRSAAAGVGNVVVLFGARTGRDGIGGASVLASAELGDADGAKRPTVQIGDPFEEAKLLECSLELLDARAARRAAGPRRGRADVVLGGDGGEGRGRARPRREQGPAPRGGHGAVRDHDLRVAGADALRRRAARTSTPCSPLCAKWEVNATAIGVVTDTRRLRVLVGDEVVGDLPVTALVDECPVYDLEPAPPSVPLYPAPPRVLDDDAAPARRCSRCSARPTSPPAARSSTQYDSIVGSRTARRPEQADAAVLMLEPEDGRRPALAVSIDGNGRRVAVDPYRGAVEAVLECSANLACVGAEPLGLTNCLNFGNPEKPHIAWQLMRAVAGLGDACRALGVPVVGGNVSLYNEGGGGPIFPTPVVGMLGELPDAARAGDARLRAGGRRDRPDRRALVGARARRLRAGQAARRARPRASSPPRTSASCGAHARRGPPGRPLRRAALGARRGRGRARRRAGRVLRRGRDRRRRRARGRRRGARCSARARARSSSPARARRSPRSAPPRG